MKRMFVGQPEGVNFAAIRGQHGRDGARRRWLVPLMVLLLAPSVTLAAAQIGASGGTGAGTTAVPALMLLQAALAGLLLRRSWRASSRVSPPGPSRVAQSRESVEALLGKGRHPSPAATDDAPGRDGAALVVRLDDSDKLRSTHGGRFMAALMQALSDRLGEALRLEDAFCHLPPDGFAIGLQPRRGLDIGTVLAIAWRIQAQLGTRFQLESLGIWPSMSIGICTSAQAARRQGLGMIDAARRASEMALRAGPGGVHSFSALDMPPTLVSCDRHEEIEHAINSGEIRAYFQPQIAAASGKVSGIEALARWQHPERGLIAPGDFLPLIERNGLSPLLARRMLDCALASLARLDAGGLSVPAVAINLSMPELRNPRLADEIAWALELHELSPERLALEILEDVIAHGDDDIMVRNVARLAAMGCGIDLDDFGTGHASITSIRRFAVSRLKIDRSFVTNMHRDRDRQRMTGAILSMAAALDLETVAEGVETGHEMAMLAEMGCTHLQGFGIARPMPEAELMTWLARHAAGGDTVLHA